MEIVGRVDIVHALEDCDEKMRLGWEIGESARDVAGRAGLSRFGNDVQSGGPAGAVGPQATEDGELPDVKIQAVKGLVSAVGLAQALKPAGAHASSLPNRRQASGPIVEIKSITSPQSRFGPRMGSLRTRPTVASAMDPQFDDRLWGQQRQKADQRVCSHALLPSLSIPEGFT